MPLLYILILAVVQGITEFLPISSSGHLVLTWQAIAAFDPSAVVYSGAERLDLDISVHVGTLIAVLCYLWRDIAGLVGGTFKLVQGRDDPRGRLALYVVAATIPVVVVGFLAKDWVGLHLRGVEIVAWANIGFALLLWLSDRLGLLIQRLEHMTFGQAMIVGFAQVLALIPGTSRAGITMTAARFLGYERREAARFSLLLAIPAIAGAGVLVGKDLYESGNLALGSDVLVGVGLSFVTALVAIALMMRWLERASFLPFVIYRLLLGAVLLGLLYL
ncbi:undecaprenyl-diphosphatase [Tistlia consotensis]|uniref:Undecaprenyl-diphosphatase n=1 Tax=Tistlia consotensis USBA 355 TaxID=560819 RepID=A0A1Y6BAA6_9PROT|nr:undecaprenyl-diphosphate phosphatase [Tistlia consotensis]SME93238.1 undecaprenyl-diphosphatase [Tistlia consotensis USBA 355]SNR28499.1 undecaprenyl-diphosphatase [Tistlia consotensis]